MAAYIQREFQVDAELIKGDRGIFDVVVNGEVVFSKHDADRFPKDDEIGEALRSRRADA